MKKKLSKKVLILTLPLTNGNYGGIMQAYALQSFMREHGYDAYTEMTPSRLRKSRVLMSIAKRILHRLVFRKGRVLIPDINRIIFGNMSDFIANHINTVKIFSSSGKIDRRILGDYSMIVVGSDQVWRSKYGDVRKYLLDFAADLDLIRISYAASFGVNPANEYDSRLVERTKSLAQEFDAISVREASAVSAVKDMWSINAVQHVDPTLLLSNDHYIKLIGDSGLSPLGDALFSYLLDTDEHKRSAVRRVAGELRLKVRTIMPKQFSGQEDIFDTPDDYSYPSPTSWLDQFDKAKFVITDSFHGCVFSIIFNKPFIAIGNKSRGLSRFTSLLGKFGLEDRLVLSAGDITKDLLTKDIDWQYVNSVRAKELRRSLDYIESYVKYCEFENE